MHFAYRVWCYYHKDWEKDLVILYPNAKLFHVTYGGRHEPLRDEGHVIEYFTGVFDNKHRKIHDGDIVKYYDDGICIAQVSWSTKMLCWSLGGADELWRWAEDPDLEILSDIHHDTVEALTKKYAEDYEISHRIKS